MKRPARQGEGALSDAIRDALALEPGLLLFRNSQAVMRKGSRIYRGGLGNGSADLVGVLAMRVHLDDPTCAGAPVARPITIGRAVALEVKRPGEIPAAAQLARIGAKMKADRRPDEQRLIEQDLWLAQVRNAGGFACFVDSVEAARAAIARARAGASS